MKFRKDFVTNSSSSSYICEICGRNESGWDMGLREAEMVECENGHTFCTDEMLETPTSEDYKDYIVSCYNENDVDELKNTLNVEESEYEDIANDHEFYYTVPEKFCPICNFIEYSQQDLKSYLKKQYGVNEDEVFEEVKKLNKRRKKLYDEEYITYVCRKFDLSPIEIVAGWKNEFGTYRNFKNSLKN